MQLSSVRVAYLLPLFVVAASGCNNPETWNFREEVILNTGESITIERTALRNNVWPRLGEGGYQSVVNQWLSESSRNIAWEMERYGGGSPFAIGQISGSLYVASLWKVDDLLYCRSHPDHYALSFWKQGATGWEPIEQSDILLDKLTANLLADLEWGNLPAAKVAVLTLEEKAVRAKRAFLPALSIRQALSRKYGASCKTILQLANWGPASASRAASVASGPS